MDLPMQKNLVDIQVMYALLLSFNTGKIGGERFIGLHNLHLFFHTIWESAMLKGAKFRSRRMTSRILEETLSAIDSPVLKKHEVAGFWY